VPRRPPLPDCPPKAILPARASNHQQTGRTLARPETGEISRPRPLAIGSPQPVRPDRAGLLPLPRTGPHRPGRTGPSGRNPLGHRGNLPNRERPNRPGPLPSPPIHRLVPPHHPVPAGPRLPHRHPVKKGDPEPGSGDLIALTVPEIRRLLTHLIWTEPPDLNHVLHRSTWRRRHQWFASVLRDGFALTAAGVNPSFSDVAAGVLTPMLAGLDSVSDVDAAVAGVMGRFGELPVYSDVADGVRALLGQGLWLVTLSNGPAVSPNSSWAGRAWRLRSSSCSRWPTRRRGSPRPWPTATQPSSVERPRSGCCWSPRTRGTSTAPPARVCTPAGSTAPATPIPHISARLTTPPAPSPSSPISSRAGLDRGWLAG